MRHLGKIGKDNRILWVDGAKIIGIWLVILGHLQIKQNIINLIFSFHMPLFFFISGYLEKNNTIKETIKNGFRTIIIPYWLLNILSYFLWVPSRILWHPELFEQGSKIKTLLVKPLLGTIFGVGYETQYSIMINVPLWFLVGLFVVKLIHSILLRVSRGNIKIYILINIPIILLVYTLKKMDIDLLVSIDSALLAFPFFSMGYFFNKTKDCIQKYTNGKEEIIKLPSIMLILILIIIMCNYNGKIDINEFNYGKNIFIFYISGIMGTIVIIFISTFYKNQNKAATIFSNGTIIIMAFHGYFYSPIIRFMGKRGETLNIITAMIISVVTLVVMLIPIVIIMKYFPIIMGKRKEKIVGKSPNVA
jgi:fucose 4-O-acetylase-like acetyltransferase